MARDLAQWFTRLPGKHKDIGLIPSTKKKPKQNKKLT